MPARSAAWEGGDGRLAVGYRIQAEPDTDARGVLSELRSRLVETGTASAGDLWDLLSDPLTGHGSLLLPVGGGEHGPGYDLELEPLAGFCFLAWPAIGCEALALGLARYPDAAFDPVSPRPRSTQLGPGWHWHGRCLTGAALFRGAVHFMAAHAAVCAALEEAGRLGLEVQVEDETGFWGSRQVDDLWEPAADGLALDLAERVRLQRILSRLDLEQASLLEMTRLLRHAAAAGAQG